MNAITPSCASTPNTRIPIVALVLMGGDLVRHTFAFAHPDQGGKAGQIPPHREMLVARDTKGHAWLYDCGYDLDQDRPRMRVHVGRLDELIRGRGSINPAHWVRLEPTPVANHQSTRRAQRPSSRAA